MRSEPLDGAREAGLADTAAGLGQKQAETAAVSLFVLLFLYKPYSGVVLHTARVTHTRRGFAVFLGAIFLIPAVLFLV